MSPDRSGASETSLRELLDSLRRHWRMIAGVTAASIILALVMILTTTPRYESEASLRIEFEDRQSSLLASLPDIADVALPSLGGEAIDTELGVLRSRRIAEAVVDSLDLHVTAVRPRMGRDSVLQVLDAPLETRLATYEYTRRGDGIWALTSFKTKVRTLPRPAQQARMGEPLDLGQATVALSPQLEALGVNRVRIRIQPFYEAVEDLRETLKVQKQEGRSQLVEVSYRSPHPHLSAGVVNGIIDNYLEYASETNHQELRKRVETLTEQVDDYRAQLRQAEEALRDYSREHRIVAAEDQAIAQVEMLAELTVNREEAVIEREALQTLLSEIQAQEGQAGPSPYRQLTAFPSFITNQGIQSMLETLIGLENARSELLVRRTPENADVRRVTERIAEVEAQLYRLASDYLNTLENQIRSADASLSRFQGELATIPDQALEYARLARETELMSELYLTLQVRLKEAEVQYAIAPEEARVVDRGLAPLEPVWPRPLITLLLATVLGVMVGVAGAVAREAVDTTVRSQPEVEAAAGGIPVVGMVPRLRLGDGRWGRLRRPWRRALPAGAGGAAGQRALLGSGGRGAGGDVAPAAEAFRTLRASIGGADAPQVLVITSPREGDGKTLSASNLAASLARRGEKVLLVDGDLRTGALHQLFGIHAAPGLADLLTGQTDLSAVLQRVILENGSGAAIDLVTGGSAGHTATELLTEERLAPILSEARAAYDRIIIDSPALHQVADAVVLGALADTVLLVVRAGVTERTLVQRTVTQLRRMDVPLGGIVLNDVDGEGAEYHALPSPVGGVAPIKG